MRENFVKSYWILVLSMFGTIGCVHSSNSTISKDSEVKLEAYREIGPYLNLLESYRKQHRQIASEPPNAQGAVKVYQRDESILYLPPHETKIRNDATSEEVKENLIDYFVRYMPQLGVSDLTKAHLNLKSISEVGSLIYLRFSQSTDRQIGNDHFFIPIEGGSIIAVLDHGHLRELHNHLLNPPALDRVIDADTIELAFSKSEFSQLIWQFKMNPVARDKFTRYLTNFTNSLNLKFEWNEFYNRELSIQRQMLQDIFRSVGPNGTQTFIMGLAKHNQLSFIKHGNEQKKGSKWMMMVSDYFDLPIEFDIELPNKSTEYKKLVFKNLRLIHNNLAEVNAYVSPTYPSGTKTLGGVPADQAKVQNAKNSSVF